MKKFWFFIILVIIIGGLSGVLASQFLTPYLIHTSPFNKIKWLRQVSNGTTIINLKEEKIIKEDTAIEDAISKISPSLVGIISSSTLSSSQLNKSNLPKNISGTGFLVTSDGLIITASSTVPAKNYQTLVVIESERLPAEVKKRDDKLGLVLLKIAKTNLMVVSFDDLDNLRLGERVVMGGVDATNFFNRFVDWGIIKSLNEKMFTISIERTDVVASGAPLINVEGLVIGMVLVDKNGNLSIVPSKEIKNFIKQ